MSKLNQFPTVYYISLEESVERQENITRQFSEHNIKPKSILSKRFSESEDIVTGKYAYTMDPGTIGCAVSHLKAIKDWYNTTDEHYAFFCEDDLSLETVQYWNFNWEQFIESIPEDADCVQLVRLKENGDFKEFDFRKRHYDDWSVTAYIITRDYAKKIIEKYCIDDTFHLEIKERDVMPLIEYIIFDDHEGVIYSCPLFVEDCKLDSTFVKSKDHNKDLHQNTHLKSYNAVIEWWKTKGSQKTLGYKEEDKITKKKIVDFTTFYGPTCKEMLELRINVLNDYVDEFIICESNKSQSGLPIEYELDETIKKLNLPKEKIKIIELEIPDNEYLPVQEIDKVNCYDGNEVNENSVFARTRERLQKDALLSVLDNYDDDTVFIHGDIDEIIKPQCIEYISNIVKQNLNIAIRIPLIHLEGRADLRVYHKDSNNPKEWTGMFMVTKKHLKNATPTQIRSNVFNPYPINFITENNVRTEDLGWHFSWMGGKEHLKIKSKSFTHYDDKFSYLTTEKYKTADEEGYYDSLQLIEGSVPPSGDTNMVLRKYNTDELPKEVFTLPNVRKFLLPIELNEDKNYVIDDLDQLLNEYSVDTEDPIKNFNLGLWYERKGHTAPALSFFLRCAERSEDKLLAYEALIWGHYCYEKQGTRDTTAKTLLQHALSVLPKRPEAYFLLSRFNRKRHWWQDSYLYATQALEFCEFENLKPLKTDVDYPGKYGIICEKAISSWWWDKADESRTLISEVKNNYVLNEEYSKLVDEYIQTTKAEHLIKSKKMDNFFNDEYVRVCNTHSDINENLPILFELSKECNHVTEMGVRSGVSTRAFLNSDVILRSYDIVLDDNVISLFERAKKIGKDVTYTQADVLNIEIEQTDLLFIDTLHGYTQLKQELNIHAKKSKKYIVFHDTQTFGTVAEPLANEHLGLLPAIIEFMIENPEWKFKIHKTNNNGLTVLEKVNGV